MKKIYETPEVYIRLLSISDILTTSPGGGYNDNDLEPDWTKLY